MHECRIYIARVSIVIFHVVEASAAFEIVSVAVCACLRFYVSDLHANTSCERITQWRTHASAASSQYAFAKRKTCNVPFKQRVEGNYSRLLCIRHSTVFAIAKAGKSGITSHYPNQQCEARSIINFSTDLLLSRATDENLFYRREYDAIHETQFHVCIPILRRVLLRKCLAEMRNNYAMDFDAM